MVVSRLLGLLVDLKKAILCDVMNKEIVLQIKIILAGKSGIQNLLNVFRKNYCIGFVSVIYYLSRR